MRGITIKGLRRLIPDECSKIAFADGARQEDVRQTTAHVEQTSTFGLTSVGFDIRSATLDIHQMLIEHQAFRHYVLDVHSRFLVNANRMSGFE